MAGIQILNDDVTMDTLTADVAKIVVVGVGGGGCNAVNRMASANPEYIDFICVNTDSAALSTSISKRKIVIGAKLTKGLGAGGRPEVGQKAAEETSAELAECLEDVDMVFITAGMGGGTGTGAAPVIAKLAKEKGILTVAVVTKPFKFEGPKRMTYALNGIENLRQNVDSLIVIPNQKLIETADKNTTMRQAYELADNVLQQGVTGISDLIVHPGEINLDFADVCTIMRDSGLAHFGIGRGKNIEDAAKQAISSPLLETSIQGAMRVLVNFTSGPDLNILEAAAAGELISASLDPNAEYMFGTAVDKELEDEVVVTVIATGLVEGEGGRPIRKMPRPAPEPIEEEFDELDDLGNPSAEAKSFVKPQYAQPIPITPVQNSPQPSFAQPQQPAQEQKAQPFSQTKVFTPVNDEADKAPDLNIPTFLRNRR